MTQSSKPLIVIVASILVLITIIILISQGLRLKYEELQRELAQLETQIKTEKTQSVALKANYQMLTEEDIIKQYAVHKLGLVYPDNENEQKIILLKEDITNLSESLESMND